MSRIPRFIRGRKSNININDDPFSHDDTVSASIAELSREFSAIGSTDVGWKETPEEYEFKIGLPGLKKEEVKVEVEDDWILHIRGERNIEKKDRVKPNIGKFMTRFRLPQDAQMDQMETNMENGVLTITIPK
ncbi:18.5 kDa class I heat shock protein-like [Cicer arietinum]|uniref:18.5 kDa class I heat shock protein-like n=1 Tax=Cicer arietinum TaxID=3827 RepID=A0A1S2YLT7_CICAR|nr:18.5 kDa class I heat shock protein-like [Cicer arietinum]